MALVLLFAVGYLAIVFEHPLSLNKSAVALVTGVACWTAVVVGGDPHVVNEQLAHHLGAHSQVLFFLLGAMTIVELVDAHDGFDIITSRVKTTNRRRLLVTVTVLSFFLSAVLDNLTTAIVMLSLVRKLAADQEDRMYLGGMVIVASNAGGAWSPIGDVTTTMLWVGGQISAGRTVLAVFLPSLASVVLPTLWIGLRRSGHVERPNGAAVATTNGRTTTAPFERRLVLAVGLGVLLLVPLFKVVTHLPPVMGILGGLGVLWTVTEGIHKRKDDETKGALSVSAAMQRIDTPSVLFFLGILLAISALETVGLLGELASWLGRTVGSVHAITVLIGLVSSIVDNVPLVAAAQGMYSLSTFPSDHTFWLFLAYCAGTGGSILIIGSAAGVAVMGMERISFGWYLRRISLPALVGYGTGALIYLLLAA